LSRALEASGARDGEGLQLRRSRRCLISMRLCSGSSRRSLT